MDRNDQIAPFWEHVAELRQTLIQCLLIVAAAIALCCWFYRDVVAIVTWPLHSRQAENPILHQEFKRERISNLSTVPFTYHIPSQTSHVTHISPGTIELSPGRYSIPPQGYLDIDVINPKNLVLLSPIDGFAATLKICFWAGMVLSSPGWIYLLLKFAAPAFEQQEWRMVIPFVCFSLLFLALGIAFAYYITIPIALQYFEGFNANIGTNLWTLSHYLDFTLFLILSNGLAFELSLILFFLVHFSIINAQQLTSKRRYMIVLAFILGAVLTPPDVTTQLMLALPLIGLYELAILYAYLRQKAILVYGRE